MLHGVPWHVILVFVITVTFTFLFFVNAIHEKKIISGVLLVWLAIVGLSSYFGVFTYLFIAVPCACIILLLTTKSGQDVTDDFDMQTLTLLHIVRVPVELVLYWLSADQFIPEM